jgi:hypothetical protein
MLLKDHKIDIINFDDLEIIFSLDIQLIIGLYIKLFNNAKEMIK